MKKMIQSLLMVTAAAVMLAACKGGGVNGSDPKAVLSEFFQRMSKKDIDGAAKLATKDSKATMDMMKKGMEMAEKMGKDAKKEDDMSEDFKDVEIGEAKITGETATVAFTNKKKGQTFDFPLKKEDGSWKVDFSMNTLNIWVQNIIKKGFFVNDSTQFRFKLGTFCLKYFFTINCLIDPISLHR